MSCKVLMGAALAVALLATSPNAVAQTSPGSSDVDFRPADAPSTASPTGASAAPIQPVTRFQQVRSMIDAARTEDAVLLCDRLLKTVNAAPPSDSLRQICAHALTTHGDRIYALGSLREAKLLWGRACALQPALNLVPAMAVRRNLLDTKTALPAMRAPVEPAGEAQGSTAPPLAPCPVCPKCEPSPPVKQACPEPPPCPTATSPEATSEPGPRAERGLGIGLGFGYDGLTSLVIGWMHEEFLSIEASVGLIFPTLDARVRFFGLKTLVTPVFGVGMLTPLGEADYFDADIQGGFPELYGHGTAVHVDLGVSYAPWPVLDLYAGVSFMTTLDGEVEMLLFFPHWSVQSVLYF